MHLKKIIFLIFTFLSLPSLAQHAVETQNLVWARYLIKLNLNSVSSISQEIEKRQFLDPYRAAVYQMRTTYTHTIGSGLEVLGGLAFFNSFTPTNPQLPVVDKSFELRPFLGLSLNYPLNEKWSLSHRLINELRYFENNFHDPTFSTTRNRYKLELRYSLNKKIYLNLYDEIFLNIGNNPVSHFDQNRWATGINFIPNSKVRFELSYINSYQSTKIKTDFIQRNNLRFTFYHQLKLK